MRQTCISRRWGSLRHIVAVCLAAVFTCTFWQHHALAQEPAASFPSHPIRFIVPYAAGGLPDTVARIVGQRLSDSLGQSVVVENKPGANGLIAAQALLGSPRDGYTWLITDGSMMSINPALYKDLAYDPQRDFLPASLIATSPLFLAAHAKTGLNSLQDFVARVKAEGANMNYGSSGIGSSHHLTMEALKAALQASITHVPFRGSGQSVPAMVGGQVDVVFAALPSLSGFAQNGAVKILATNSGQRSALAPDIAAISEVVPGFDFTVTIGALAATGTSEYAVDRISRAIGEAMRDTSLVKQFNSLGIEPVGGNAQSYARAIEAERKRYAQAIATADIKTN